MTSTGSGSPIVEALKRAVFPSYALLAAIQLDLFTQIQDSSKTAEKLAAEMGVDSDKLSALLYPMVLVGLLKVEDGCFSNTFEASQYLVRGKPGYMGDEYEAFTSRWRAVSKTAESIRSGKAQAKVVIPALPSLLNFEFLVAYTLVDPTNPTVYSGFSNAVPFIIGL